MSSYLISVNACKSYMLELLWISLEINHQGFYGKKLENRV